METTSQWCQNPNKKKPLFHSDWPRFTKPGTSQWNPTIGHIGNWLADYNSRDEVYSSYPNGTKQGEGQPEPESFLILPTSPTSSSTDLVVSELARQGITADFIFSMIAPAKAPFSLIASEAITLATPESFIIATPQQSCPSANTPLTLEVNFKDEFIEELIEGFYKSLKSCLSMFLKSTRTSFASWRPIFSQVIENIRDVGGTAEAKSWKKWSATLKRMSVNGEIWSN